jgi:hypothetical protein
VAGIARHINGMSTIEPRGQFRLDTAENVSPLLNQWTESLEQVLESMTDHRPAVAWQAVSGTRQEVAAANGAGPEEEILWWEQPLQISPDMLVWVGAPKTSWEHAGTLTLKAAGLETVESAEAKNTWVRDSRPVSFHTGPCHRRLDGTRSNLRSGCGACARFGGEGHGHWFL